MKQDGRLGMVTTLALSILLTLTGGFQSNASALITGPPQPKASNLGEFVLGLSGTLDPDFGDSGKVITAVDSRFDNARALVIQPDGKLVASGNLSTGGSSRAVLVRYNHNGSLDSSFGTGGIVTTSFDTWTTGNGLALQPDGKLVQVGGVSSGAGSGYSFVMARYETNGSLDSSFGSGGKVVTPVSSLGCSASSVAIQADGKLVAAGYAIVSSQEDFAVVRYNADGTLDTTFGNAGIVTTPVGTFYDRINSLAIQNDGKIVAVGNAQSGSQVGFATVRYYPNGSLDNSFGTGGKLVTYLGNEDIAYAVRIQPDGKLVLAGMTRITSQSHIGLVRYNPDGTPDISFGNEGKVITAIGSSSDAAYAMAIQPNGQLVVAGMAQDAGYSNFALVRYDADGRLDPFFGTLGIVKTVVGTYDSTARAIAIQDDGKIVAAGETSMDGFSDFALVRYLSPQIEYRSFVPLTSRSYAGGW